MLLQRLLKYELIINYIYFINVITRSALRKRSSFYAHSHQSPTVITLADLRLLQRSFPAHFVAAVL